ncbi:MAG: UbiA family prenyltransferase [Anaerolineales bacterium]|nr:UbiA family prenyltransferase [Anaerolineales bacterium]
MQQGKQVLERIIKKFGFYWKLIKSLQTGLLVLTDLAGYISARCPMDSWRTLLGVAGSLFLAVSGSTILNMVLDRDMDAKMERTAGRPLPKKLVTPSEARAVGLILGAAGVGWSLYLAPLYGAVVLAGLIFDVLVYTHWLKRRTPWSIIWVGISGGMPILAGRDLAEGRIDFVGILLALAVLFWIPTHILTFGIKYAQDYHSAGVPVFANTDGLSKTRLIIAISTIGTVAAMILAAYQMEMVIGFWRTQIILGALLLTLTITSILRPSAKLNFGLFKMASLYMLGSMGLIIFGL